MTTEPHHPESSQSPEALPVLSDTRIDAIESQVFAAIGAERASSRSARSRRRGLWLTGAAAAGVIAVAAVISPSILAGLSPTNESGAVTDASSIEIGRSDEAVGGSDLATDPSTGGNASESSSGLTDGAAPIDTAGRDVITTAWASVRVDDVRAAADEVSQEALARGGYVESLSLGTGPVYGMPIDSAPETTSSTQPTASTAWITVRVPSDELPAVIETLAEVGEVTASSVDRYDVTAQVIDLDARIEASQASVDRLLALVAQAESVSDLIAAESALAERQATLESYLQQRESLQDQVQMSTLSVTLEVRNETIEADPAGFWDGLVAGWNGLLAAANGVVIAIGFLIPWIAVLTVVGAAVWGIVTLARRRRRSETPPGA